MLEVLPQEHLCPLIVIYVYDFVVTLAGDDIQKLFFCVEVLFSEFSSPVSSSAVRNRIHLVLFGANFISVYCKGCLLSVRVLTQVLE